jgi:hypothetical protein
LPALFVWVPEEEDVPLPDDAGSKTPVEIIPSVQGGISAIASAHAPFLYFENAPTFAHLNGIIRVTLTAGRDIPLTKEKAAFDEISVAHLRMNLPAARALKAALEGALLLATPVAQTATDPGGTSRPN